MTCVLQNNFNSAARTDKLLQVISRHGIAPARLVVTDGAVGKTYGHQSVIILSVWYICFGSDADSGNLLYFFASKPTHYINIMHAAVYNRRGFTDQIQISLPIHGMVVLRHTHTVKIVDYKTGNAQTVVPKYANGQCYDIDWAE